MNPLCLLIAHANGYIEEKGVNKSLVFDSTNENKELLKIYNDVWNGIRDQIKEISSVVSGCWFNLLSKKQRFGTK